MHLIVCIKQILDPEMPPSDFRLDTERGQAAETGPLVISIFDENALEVALQMRDKAGGGKLTALCLGPDSAVDALRKALSMRADEAILLREADFPNLDAQGAARVLAAAIRRMEPADLVLCGREAGDWHGGAVPGFLAAELDLPFTNLVANLETSPAGVHLRRQSDDGWEIIESALPAVVSVTNDDTNLPRIPKVRDNMMAFRKQIPVWGIAELDLRPQDLPGPNAALEKIRLYVPAVEKKCEILDGQTSAERAQQLVQRLSDMQVI